MPMFSEWSFSSSILKKFITCSSTSPDINMKPNNTPPDINVEIKHTLRWAVEHIIRPACKPQQEGSIYKDSPVMIPPTYPFNAP